MHSFSYYLQWQPSEYHWMNTVSYYTVDQLIFTTWISAQLNGQLKKRHSWVSGKKLAELVISTWSGNLILTVTFHEDNCWSRCHQQMHYIFISYIPMHSFTPCTALAIGDECRARLVFASSKCDHIMPLLCQLHWLKVPWRIDYKLAVLVYKCLYGLAPSYLDDELHHPAESLFRRCLHSASSHELSVPRTRLSTYGDQAFPAAAVRIWNSLPQHITSAPSLPVFCSCLKTYFFELCYP